MKEQQLIILIPFSWSESNVRNAISESEGLSFVKITNEWDEIGSKADKFAYIDCISAQDAFFLGKLIQLANTVIFLKK